jgi:hypothetical protein
MKIKGDGMTEIEQIESRIIESTDGLAIDLNTGWVLTKHVDGQWVTQRRALYPELARAIHKLKQMESRNE